jgi:hypothetical protein
MMSEVTSEVVDTPEPTETNPTELRAKEMGWRPLDEFNGDEVDFIDAKEFIRRQPLFDKIEHQNKHLKNVSKALEAMKVHYTRVEEAAVQKALTSLKAQRKQALSDGDGDSFEVFDDEIKKTETQLTQITNTRNTPLVEEPTIHPEWDAFNSRNPWYNTEDHMRLYADKVGAKLAQQGVSPSDVLKQVEVAIKKEFPQKFRNPNKEDAPDVSSGRNQPSRIRNENVDLSEQERKIMHTLVSQGVMTKEKYLADLKEIKSR